jgi:hypothetical protein
MELEQLRDHGKLAPMPNHDASNNQWNAPCPPNGWQDDRAIASEYGNAPFSITHNHLAHRRTSGVTANNIPNSSTQTASHFLRVDKAFDSRSFQSTGLTNSHPLGPPTDLDMALFDVNTQREPWSPYHTAGVYQAPDMALPSDWHDIPKTTPSATDHDESGSGYVGDVFTPLTSTDYASEHMVDSGVTERQALGTLQYTDSSQFPISFAGGPYGPPSQSFPIHIERSRALMETPSTPPGSSHWGSGGLAVPMQRISSIHSSASEASSTGAPPVHTPEMMYCDERDCRQPFTGLYRRGNLARHKRLKHGKGKPYVCEDLTCAKEFRRQDARLKHYRKYHCELAASSPFVPRSTASRPVASEQEVDLSNISSWAG